MKDWERDWVDGGGIRRGIMSKERMGRRNREEKGEGGYRRGTRGRNGGVKG